jgi:hypothetical protein
MTGLFSARLFAFELAFPVDCTLGQDCYIQNYVDADPGPDAQDATCGHLTYDGHRGTDIALPPLADMARDVAVRPAAPGTVQATRDGMPDILVSAEDAPDVTGRECGNGVVIAHADGWRTMYCHLKRGSIAVQSGDTVDLSTELGAIGLSGLTEFPHLHLTVNRNEDVVDPFRPNAAPGTCGPVEDTLWRDDRISYEPTGFLGIGGWPAVPDYADVTDGKLTGATLAPGDGAFVVWVYYFGPKAGDELDFDVKDPSGAPFFATTIAIDRTQVRAFRAAGKRRGAGPFAVGAYPTEVTWRRNGKVIETISTTLQVR